MVLKIIMGIYTKLVTVYSGRDLALMRGSTITDIIHLILKQKQCIKAHVLLVCDVRRQRLLDQPLSPSTAGFGFVAPF